MDKFIYMPIVKKTKQPILEKWQTVKSQNCIWSLIIEQALFAEPKAEDKETKQKLSWFYLKKSSKLNMLQHSPDYKHFHGFNRGICTGKYSGITVIDIDVKSGGVDLYNDILKKYNNNNPVDTLTAITPSGGIHLYFKYIPEYTLNAIGFLPGFDLKNNRGQVLCYPSITEKGQYKYVDDKAKIKKMPKWLREVLEENKKIFGSEHTQKIKNIINTLTNTEINKKLVEKIETINNTDNLELYIKMLDIIDIKYIDDFMDSKKIIWGCANQSSLLKEPCRKIMMKSTKYANNGDNWFNTTWDNNLKTNNNNTIATVMHYANLSNPTTYKLINRQTKKPAIIEFVDDGFNVPISTNNNIEPITTTINNIEPITTTLGNITVPFEIDLSKFSHKMVVMVTKHLYKNKYLYKEGETKSRWYEFNGVSWTTINAKKNINNIVTEEIHDFFEKLASRQMVAELRNIDRENDEDGHYSACVKKWFKVKQNINKLLDGRIIKVIIGMLETQLEPDGIKFNKDPFLFAFKNCIYNLKSGEFVEGKYDDYIDTTTDNDYVEPEPHKIELIQKMLSEIFPIKEEKDAYLTILSTALSGKQLQKLVIANGCGGNGKSLLHSFLMYMLGSYAYSAPVTYLVDGAKGQSHEVASMGNKRFILFSEPAKDKTMNDTAIKQITGDAVICARKIYQGDTKTKMGATVIIEANSRPKMNEASPAIARRIIDVLFRSEFTENYDPVRDANIKNRYQMNKDYSEDNFREEYSSALFKILAGYYKNYINNKELLNLPQSIIDRSREYILDSDDLMGWLNGYIEITQDKNDFVKVKDIFTILKRSQYWTNADKKTKKITNMKRLIKLINEHFVFSQFFKAQAEIKGKTVCSVIRNHKFKKIEGEDDEDDEEDGPGGNLGQFLD